MSEIKFGDKVRINNTFGGARGAVGREGVFVSDEGAGKYGGRIEFGKGYGIPVYRTEIDLVEKAKREIQVGDKVRINSNFPFGNGSLGKEGVFMAPLPGSNFDGRIKLDHNGSAIAINLDELDLIEEEKTVTQKFQVGDKVSVVGTVTNVTPAYDDEVKEVVTIDFGDAGRTESFDCDEVVDLFAIAVKLIERPQPIPIGTIAEDATGDSFVLGEKFNGRVWVRFAVGSSSGREVGSFTYFDSQTGRELQANAREAL